MLFLSKYFSGKQHIRDSYRRLFRTFMLRNICNNNHTFKEFERCKNKDSVSRDNMCNGNNRRAISTQVVMKPENVAFSTETRVTFMKFLPNIIKDLTEDEIYSDIPEATKRFSDVLQYNLAIGRYFIGLSILSSYETLEKPENLTKENIRLGTILAWCGELLATSILLADDIMDNSETRQNAPCWFKIEDIGLSAVNDILFLENSSYFILKKYFASHPAYVPIMEYFHEVNLKTIHGQCVDIIKPKIEEITLDRYIRSVIYRNGYPYSIPTILGMYLTGTYSTELHRNIEPILHEINIYLQIENDMWDCFGDKNVIDNIGSDIQHGKCTWPALVALQKASPLQRKLMEAHYGKPEKKSVEIIRNLYEDLDIASEFASYKEKNFKRICKQIREVPMNDAMRTFLFIQAERIFNRNYG